MTQEQIGLWMSRRGLRILYDNPNTSLSGGLYEAEVVEVSQLGNVKLKRGEDMKCPRCGYLAHTRMMPRRNGGE